MAMSYRQISFHRYREPKDGIFHSGFRMVDWQADYNIARSTQKIKKSK